MAQPIFLLFTIPVLAKCEKHSIEQTEPNVVVPVAGIVVVAVSNPAVVVVVVPATATQQSLSFHTLSGLAKLLISNQLKSYPVISMSDFIDFIQPPICLPMLSICMI